MKLLSFAVAGPYGTTRHLGAAIREDSGTTQGVVIDLTVATQARLVTQGVAPGAALRVAYAVTPPEIVAFIEAGQVGLDAAWASLDWATDAGADAGPDGAPLRYGLGTVTYLPAVTGAPLLRDFMAFEEHLRNTYPRLGRTIPSEWYQIPVYYKGNTASLGAHGEPVCIPTYADELDFELEVAAVIGPGGSDIAREDAARHIYGYTIYNDFSARAIQRTEMAVGLGPAKGKDFRGAHVLGPWLVTADEIPDPYGLQMEARVNGELWTVGSTADMHWRFTDMITHASRDEALRAGEVFGSGTVGGGSGAERDVFLHPGDEVTLTVARLGTLTNRVTARPDPEPSGREL